MPAAMLLIRNQHGSHNPNEAREMADVVAALDVPEAAIWEIAA